VGAQIGAGGAQRAREDRTQLVGFGAGGLYIERQEFASIDYV
jgi:hypothetical protein